MYGRRRLILALAADHGADGRGRSDRLSEGHFRLSEVVSRGLLAEAQRRHASEGEVAAMHESSFRLVVEEDEREGAVT